MRPFIAVIVVFSTMTACDSSSAPEPEETAALSYGVLGRCSEPLGLRWFYDGSAEPDGPADVAGVVREAASVWNDTGFVLVREAPSADAAHVVVSWHGADVEDCAPFLDFEGSLAHARGVAGRDAAEIHIDDSRPFTRPLLLAALIHELGHVLGLDHSRDPASVMYPVAREHPRGLGRSDLAGLRCLYGDGDLGFHESFHRIVIDLEGDGLVDELIFSAGELQTFKRDAEGRVIRSFGPTPGEFDPQDPSQRLVVLEDGRAAVVKTLADGRYRAVALDGTGQPSDPWYAGRPLRTKDGPMDADGDGVLDDR